MKEFMGKDFLLTTDTAVKLYHEYAAKMPVLDYHCHISPEEIAKDRKFENITQLWLGGDYYKWRQMRSNGVEGKYITGNAPDREKFQKWAETMEKAIGNPLYHWSHLELQRYFGYYGALNSDTAEEVWNLCCEKLKDSSLSARTLMKQSDVTLICTTDDPAGVKISSFADLKAALKKRMEFFNEMGCRTSDHGLDYAMYVPASDEEVEKIFTKAVNGGNVTKEEELKYKTTFMIFAGREYHRLGWAMQLHYGCKRDNDVRRYKQLGADTGFDCIDTYTPSAQLSELLNALSETGELPKTILYSLNPNDNAAIGTIIGCFQDATS